MRVYYAHCQAIYGTKQELRDLDVLMALGFEVVNPSSPEHAQMARNLKAAGQGERVMDYFVSLVDGCDAVAFRALPDGAIPAGVAKEVARAADKGKPVIELPHSVLRRTLTREQTHEYLAEVGQR
jgi:hypothetical protein